MKAMILAAGKGTRLYPLTAEIPKPMVPVAGKPVLQHNFELLAGEDVEETYVNVYHLSEVILGSYGERHRVGSMTVKILHEDELMGTAGGVKRLAGCFDETFVVIMGDALTDVDLRKLVVFHKERKALATLALARVADISRYGVVEQDSEKNILGFREKPSSRETTSNLVSTGIYVLEPEVLGYVPENTFFDFARDVFPRLLEAGERIVGYEGDFYWSDIGTLEACRTAQVDALSRKVKLKVPGERRGESLWVGRHAHLHPTAIFEGRVVLGRDVMIGRGAAVTGDTTIGRGCRVRPRATVKRSILLSGACVGYEAYVEDCIIGPGYTVGPGEQIRSGTFTRGTSSRDGESPLPVRSGPGIGGDGDALRAS